MKIAIVHSFYTSKLPSGENTVVKMQYEALRQAGHEVILVGAHTDELAKKPGFRSRSAFNVITGSGIDPTVELEEFAPDVIHIHNLFPNFSTKWLSRWDGPIVATLHNYRPVCASGILFRDGTLCTLCPDGSQLNSVKNACYRDSRIATLPLAIRNRNGVNSDPILSRVDHTIFLSKRSKASYESFGYKPKISSIVPNFVDNESIITNFHENSAEWIYVGRLAPEKGIVKFLEQWPAADVINVYGDGPDYDAVLGMASQNIRVHGLKSRSIVLEAISKAKGLAIPSTCAENFPTVYAESLAAGVPIVGKSGNAAADDITISNSGVVFSDWQEVPGAIGYVNHMRQELSLAAKSRFEERFMKESWLDAMLTVYQPNPFP